LSFSTQPRAGNGGTPERALQDPLATRAPGGGALAIKPLLHPTEPSRLAIALVPILVVIAAFVALMIASGNAVAIAVLLGVLALFLGSIWLAIQVHRAHLLGRSVRVTRQSLPAVQDALDEVRDQLTYHRPIDVYVAAKLPEHSIVLSYLGTKMILIEGSLIGDLLTPERRPELKFLLARYVGAFKARHMRLDILALLISAVHEIRALNLFLNPYYRATSYSGDQIGLACAGDLRIALSATERLMTGKEVEPAVAARGVVDQAALVSHRVLPRLAQLFSPEPHLTNRYLNLLFYAKAHHPEAWRAFQDELDERTAGGLRGLSSRSPHRAGTLTEAADEAPPAIVEEWESSAGAIASAVIAALAAALFTWGTFAAPGSLDLLGTATLVVDAVLVAGLLLTSMAVLIRRAPALVALGAFLSAALAGWTGLLPVVDAVTSEFGETNLSLWLSQAAGAAALVACIGFVAGRGRLATLMERRPTRSSRLWEVGVVAGGIVVIVSSFLDYYEFEGTRFSVWELSTGIYDVLVVVLGAAVICAGLAATLSHGDTLPWSAALVGCITFFFVFTPSDFNEDYSLEIGWWLALGGAAMALACSLIGWLTARPVRTIERAAGHPPL
jgi:hypothetical protein